MAERPEQLSCYPNGELATQIQESADDKEISVSKWLIEASRNKLQSEEN